MKTADAQEFEKLLGDLCEADFELRRAKAARARAHTAVLSFVSQRVPAGTMEAEALDIPAFLRTQAD